ncbi:hypothetical protein KY284_021496 [Solanum tuberosum]|nr:hypothetical protein KY284_021496 [Solanum tuberosum]
MVVSGGGKGVIEREKGAGRSGSHRKRVVVAGGVWLVGDGSCWLMVGLVWWKRGEAVGVLGGCCWKRGKGKMGSFPVK